MILNKEENFWKVGNILSESNFMNIEAELYTRQNMDFGNRLS